MMADAGDLHPMFQEMLRRSDGWTNNVNESSLDYDFITRHPAMSFIFLTLTGLALTVGNVGNILVGNITGVKARSVFTLNICDVIWENPAYGGTKVQTLIRRRAFCTASGQSLDFLVT